MGKKGSKYKKPTPGMYFFARDWFYDERLMGCSLAAQGAWIELICLMYMLDGKGILPGDLRQIAQIAPRADTVDGWVEKHRAPLLELEARKVFSRGRDAAADMGLKGTLHLPDDAIVSRRILRDYLKKNERSEHARKAALIKHHGFCPSPAQCLPNPAQCLPKACPTVCSTTPANIVPFQGVTQENPAPVSAQGLPEVCHSLTLTLPKDLNTPRILNARETNEDLETTLRTLLGDIMLLHGNRWTPDWQKWWQMVLRVILFNDGLPALQDAIRYAKDCMDERTRKAKDLGLLKNPGAYVGSKAIAWAKAAGVRLPDTPKRTS